HTAVHSIPTRRSSDLTIYFAKSNLAGQWEALPVFLMLEKANEQDCSVALCLPAADPTDLEWGVVCTKADEGRPVTIDESLKDIRSEEHTSELQSRENL